MLHCLLGENRLFIAQWINKLWGIVLVIYEIGMFHFTVNEWEILIVLIKVGFLAIVSIVTVLCFKILKLKHWKFIADLEYNGSTISSWFRFNVERFYFYLNCLFEYKPTFQNYFDRGIGIHSFPYQQKKNCLTFLHHQWVQNFALLCFDLFWLMLCYANLAWSRWN